jgi:adenylosuccinate lyase
LQKLSEVPGLKEVPPFSEEANCALENIISSFDVAEALTIKAIERVTNHDVKAVEYYLKEKLGEHDELATVTTYSSHLANRISCIIQELLL